MFPASRSTRHLVSAALCLFGFAIVGFVGLWIHICVLPLPVESTLGIIARFVYFLAWLAALIYLLGRAFFNRHSELWHGSVFFLLGGAVGLIGGFFFAFWLGAAVGAVSGIVVGPLVFALRHCTTRVA